VSGPTREELTAVAAHLHDEGGCGCDPKYLTSCPRMAAAVLEAGRVIRERSAPYHDGDGGLTRAPHDGEDLA
jgi:hypothetical protein